MSVPARRPILQSWERCAGMPADAADDPQSLRRGELQDRLAQNAGLLQAAASDMDTLAGLVSSASSLVLLADAAGTILQTSGNTDFLQRADQVALRPGVSWSEQDRGTNAIGTVLVEASPLRVHGREHFLARNQILSCHAAPIHSARGELLGVLDISGDAHHLYPYALGLATLGARQIANRLLAAPQAGRRVLVFHRQSALLDSAERGMLLIEDGHIVGANATAIGLLGTTWARVLDRPMQDWLPDWQRLGTQGGAVRSEAGEAFHAVWQTPAIPAPVRARAPATVPAPLPARARQLTLAADAHAQLHRAAQAVDAGLGVLVQGETGAGKEVFAQRLHAASRWRTGPLVAVNCGALPETLIEAELFGYEAGAYTGARRQGSRGLLREADGGMLFLDEIGDMPLTLQTRLLRVLQEREVQPLGGGKPVPVAFGLVSATNRDLHAMMADGRFRADLFYRLQDLGVTLAPLREREDLATFIQTELAALTPAGVPTLRLAADALACLVAYDWPGNYRQLHSVLRSLALFHPEGGALPSHALPAQLTPRTAPAATVAEPSEVAQSSLRLVSDQHIAQTLARHGGSMTAAARELGVHRSTLYRWCARHGQVTAGASVPPTQVRSR